MLKYLKIFFIKFILLCLIFLCTFVLRGFPQTNNAATDITQQFETYQQKNLQEKIFVHTDKSFYLAGEIIWFKIYDVDAAFHKPLDISKVAYTEILDNNNKPVLQAKIALKNGSGSGSFYIPVTANSGNYKLRAYTNWMKNFGADYFFEKTITILNSQKIYAFTDDKKAAQYDIRFFPEGGDLVNNIQSKLAFKAVDENGMGIEFAGAVIDEANDTIVKFQPLKFGMGNFYFTPVPAHTYKAIINIKNGPSIVKELPAVSNEGYVMSVINTDNNQLKINIQSTEKAQQEVYLIVHTHGLLKVAQSTTPENGNAIFLIDKNILGDGISQITLFNSNKQPLCERLYFKRPQHKLQIDLTADQQEYALRKKVNIDINTSDENENKKMADLSMAVYKLDSLQTLNETTINNYLLLTSDLKGNIESPEYYFSGTQADEAADNLMLTQGWRRFRWNDVLQNRLPVLQFPPEYNGHIFTGKLINTETNQLASGIETYLSVPGTKTQFVPDISDNNGFVKFEMKDFYGSPEIIVQNSPDDSIYRTDIANPFFEKYSTNTLSPFTLPKKYPNTILDQSISMQVQNIYEGYNLKQFNFPNIDTSAFYASPDERYLLDDYTRFTTMEEDLREYVQLILVNIRKQKYHISVFDVPANKVFDNDPLVLLDGVPVFDLNKFIAVDPLKVRSIDVITKKYFLGTESFNGIINCVTYKGDLANYQLDPHATVLEYAGLQLQREFYSPKYETAQQASSHFPDFRNVLYWSPDITTNEKGQQKVSFYTSDIAGKYAIVVQGITADGRCGYNYKIIEVKK